MFLKALEALDRAAQSPQHRAQALNHHCLIEDLLPTLFDRHFEFTILTPPALNPEQSQELVAKAHAAMWQQVEPTVAELLTPPRALHPARFKDAVEAELQRAIEEVNRQYARDGVTVRITSNNPRAIARRQW
jgi:hypothetical protein